MTTKEKIEYLLERVLRNVDTIAEIWDIIANGPKSERAELFETFIKKYQTNNYSDEITLVGRFSSSAKRQIKFDLKSVEKINSYASEVGKTNPETAEFYEKVFDFINDDENFPTLENKVAAIIGLFGNEYAYYYQISSDSDNEDIYDISKDMIEDELFRAKRILYDDKYYGLSRGSLIYEIYESLPEESGLRKVFMENVFQMIENHMAFFFAKKLIDNDR